jgi:16S rRNA (guanine966-N2)-methyltransferase
MRIVGGRHRGRPLSAPAGGEVRPTADRTREAVFNILLHGLGGAGAAIEGAAMLDVFAGTGAMGLEALSRGAERAVFIERDNAAIAALRDNAARLNEPQACLVLRLDASNLPPPPQAAGAPLDYAFLDAPYGSDLSGPALAGLKDRGWITAGTIVTVEVAAKEVFAPPPGYDVLDERRWGAAKVVFLEVGD